MHRIWRFAQADSMRKHYNELAVRTAHFEYDMQLAIIVEIARMYMPMKWSWAQISSRIIGIIRGAI